MTAGTVNSSMAVGPFRIQDTVAQGGMATVYRAYMQDSGQEVALKISRFSDSDRRYGNALRFEADLLQKLEHPNIVPIIPIPLSSAKAKILPVTAKALKVKGSPWYYAMEFMHGGSLLEYVERGGTLPADIVVSIIYQVARGLHYLNEMGYAHLDIKTENILFRYKMGSGMLIHPVIVDFGVAAQNSRGLQATGGTLLIMAPERLDPKGKGDNNIDPGKMDVYSLGVTMYRILTGQYPFAGFSQRALISAILNDPIVPPDEVRLSVPHEVSRLTMACLEKTQAERISLPELIRSLERIPYRITRLTRDLD